MILDSGQQFRNVREWCCSCIAGILNGKDCYLETEGSTSFALPSLNCSGAPIPGGP